MVIPPPVTDAEPEPDIRSHHNGHTTELHNEQLGAAPANDHGIATGTTGPAEPTTTRDHDFAPPQHMTGAPASPPIAPSPAHNNAPSPKVILPVAAHQAPTISTLSDHDGTDDGDDDEHADPTYWQGFKNMIRAVPVLVTVPVLCPTAWALHFSHQNPVAVFVVSLLSIVPLAGGLGFATEELANRIGDAWGGLLNATFGNAVELLIAILALVKGDLDIVQASMAGSILSNILLVLGMSYFAGGLRFHEQLYAVVGAQTHIALLGISVAAILLPEAYHLSFPSTTEAEKANLTNRASTEMSPQELKTILAMSRGLSFILLIVYVLYLTFQLYTHAYLFKVPTAEQNHDDLPEPDHHRVFPRPHWVPSLRTVMSRDTFTHNGRSTPSPLPPHITRSRPSIPITDADGDIGGFTTHSRRSSHVDLENNRYRSHSVTSYLASPTKERGPDMRLREKRASDTDESNISPLETAPRTPNSLHFNHANVDVVDIEQQRFKRRLVPRPKPKVPVLYAFAALLAFTGLAGITAECLVDSIDGLTEHTSVSREFIGLIVLPVVGNAVEHITAVTVSLKDRLNLSLSIAVGSSVQVSLCILPLLVLVGWMIGQPMSLLFDTYETICLVVAIIIVNAAIADGRTNFLEGAVLMMTFVCIAVVTWYYDPVH